MLAPRARTRRETCKTRAGRDPQPLSATARGKGGTGLAGRLLFSACLVLGIRSSRSCRDRGSTEDTLELGPHRRQLQAPARLVVLARARRLGVLLQAARHDACHVGGGRVHATVGVCCLAACSCWRMSPPTRARPAQTRGTSTQSSCQRAPETHGTERRPAWPRRAGACPGPGHHRRPPPSCCCCSAPPRPRAWPRSPAAAP